ncbi:LamG domain-containing protein [Candidatus Micrarchaeota archaeon]|nr:LamG domain-containing protein [Candidatus Micrarchaeota archaeon]
MKRGQGAFEYVLLMAGVLLIVVLSVAVFRGLSGKSLVQIQESTEKIEDLNCLPHYWKSQHETILAYRMNEGSGSIVHDQGPKQNHGDVTGAEWATDICKFGTCLKFDDDDDQDQIVPEQMVALGPDGITVMLWYTADGYQTDDLQPILFRGSPSLSFMFDLSVPGGGPASKLQGNLRFVVATASGAARDGTDEFQLNPNEPAHIAFTYDVATQEKEIYINGERQGVNPTGSGAILTTPGTIVIGNRMDTMFLNGRVSDLAVYSRALTQREIQQQMWCSVR